jgi:hypothetical protein
VVEEEEEELEKEKGNDREFYAVSVPQMFRNTACHSIKLDSFLAIYV